MSKHDPSSGRSMRRRGGNRDVPSRRLPVPNPTQERIGWAAAAQPAALRRHIQCT
jgi:hypothetical protein